MDRRWNRNTVIVVVIIIIITPGVKIPGVKTKIKSYTSPE